MENKVFAAEETLQEVLEAFDLIIQNPTEQFKSCAQNNVTIHPYDVIIELKCEGEEIS